MQKIEKNMINRYPTVFMCFSIPLLSGVLSGCASHNNQSFLREEYKNRKIQESQRHKDLSAMEDEITKKIPEETAGDFERSGDENLKQGNTGQAFVQYDKALRLEPGLNRVRYKVGSLLFQKGMLDEALKEFEEMLKNNPDDASGYEGEGMVFFAKGEWDASEKNFKRAITIDAKSWGAHTYLGIIYDRQKRYAESQEEYTKALEINQKSSVIYNNMGISYFLKGEYDRAKESFERALKIEPENNRIYNNLGVVLCRMERPAEALSAFKSGGDVAGAYNNLGYLYMMEQKYPDALNALDKALEIKPNYYEKAQENKEIAAASFSTSLGSEEEKNLKNDSK